MRILEVLPEIVGPVKLLVAVALADLVHRLEVRHQLGLVGHVALAREPAAAEPAHVPDDAVERLGLEGEERILQGPAGPRIRLDVDGVDVPFGFCRALEPLLALRAGVRLFSLVLSASPGSATMMAASSEHGIGGHTSILLSCRSVSGLADSSCR